MFATFRVLDLGKRLKFELRSAVLRRKRFELEKEDRRYSSTP